MFFLPPSHPLASFVLPSLSRLPSQIGDSTAPVEGVPPAEFVAHHDGVASGVWLRTARAVWDVETRDRLRHLQNSTDEVDEEQRLTPMDSNAGISAEGHPYPP